MKSPVGAVNGHAATGRVERFKPVGGYVKVLLRLPTGDEVTVEVPRSELRHWG